MATRKKSPMGADPLAWMKQEDVPHSMTAEVSEFKPKPRRRSQRRDGLEVALLEETFATLAPQGEALVARFYEELFARFPEVRPMFANTDPAQQQKKLLAALQLVVASLRRPAQLRKTLLNLGEKHHAYGAKEEHYTAVAEMLLDVMAEFAGDLWTDKVAGAWRNALNTVAATMLSADEVLEEKTMAASKKEMESVMGSSEALNSLEAMYSILEHSPINIMIADADENIIFVNKQALDTLTSVE
ncbi:Methyl-accepting chemotaxis protein I (serine chemoreceptor protein), partial [hydrothermal vent metagenome]